MFLCMKTTVDIVDPLLAEAKRMAAREGTTIRALIEEGLRRVIQEREERREFSLRRVTFDGNGVRPEVGEGSWDRIRDMAYKGRGA